MAQGRITAERTGDGRARVVITVTESGVDVEYGTDVSLLSSEGIARDMASVRADAVAAVRLIRAVRAASSGPLVITGTVTV